MRTRLGQLKWLLALLLMAAARCAYGQPVPPADPLFPAPLGGTEAGGWYFAAQFAYFEQSNPLRQQLVAFRGFTDVDGSISGGPPGTFVGSKEPALGTAQVSGPTTFQPGLWLHTGWRFEDGLVIDVSWLHLTEARYSATATLVPVDFQVAGHQQDSFVSSPVFNFPSNYAGPTNDLAVGNPGATFGIWNAASSMTIEMLQRFEQADLTARVPMHITDNWRTYGLIGARAVILWERFRWLTVDANVNGTFTETDTAVYNNIVSNRLYGPHVGCGNEWYLGSTPIGAFSVSLDLDAALMLDFVKERADYELGDRSTTARRNLNTYTFAPELMGSLAFWWYPTQGIQVRLGWDVMAFFNTMSSPIPIDFNYGAINPSYDSTLRVFQGVNFGVGFAF